MKTAEWIDALRSGKYEQGMGYLCKGGKYCCLGVLAEIKGYESQLRPKTDGVGDAKQFKIGQFWSDCVIPKDEQPKVLEDLDLTVRDEHTDHDTVSGHLIDMNDNGKSFQEIADWLEEYTNGRG